MGPFLKSSCLPLWFLVHMLQFRSHFIKDHWWQVAQRQLTVAGSGLGWDWKWSVKHCVISDCPAFLTTNRLPPPSLHFFTARWIFPRREREENKRERGGEPTLRFPAEHAAKAFGHRVVEVGFGCARVCAHVHDCMHVCPPMVCKWIWRWIGLWPSCACVFMHCSTCTSHKG